LFSFVSLIFEQLEHAPGSYINVLFLLGALPSALVIIEDIIYFIILFFLALL